MKRGLLIFTSVLMTSGISGSLGYILAKNSPSVPVQLVSPLPNLQTVTPSPSSAPPDLQKKSGLDKAVKQSLETSSGTYGIYIKNLSSGEIYLQNDRLQLPAASLYKLWVMGEAFSAIASGDLNRDEVLSDNISSLNSAFNIPPDSAELTSGFVSLSVSDALENMITISHNYAALLLVKRLSLPAITRFLSQNNLTRSTIGEDSLTTSGDVGNFLEKLYLGKIVNSEISSQMLSLLTRQTLNSKIPKYLPSNTLIAHKTGELDNVSHDAGIVYSPKATYIIVILTQSDSPPDAAERISQISAAVYKYFNP